MGKNVFLNNKDVLLNKKILMYSHDCSGLGHTSRTLSIAAHLAKEIEDCSIMLVTDLSITGHLNFPQNVDFIHLPCIMQRSEDNFYHTNLDIDIKDFLTLRRKITKSAIKSFDPGLIIIESDPSVLPHEMKHTFGFVRKRYPGTRVVWGIPDILGDPETVKKDWIEKDVYRVMDRVCDEIWVHGVQDVFDVVEEYAFPQELANKTHYTGYMRVLEEDVRKYDEYVQENTDKPYVLVTAGSGAEGFSLLDNYLASLEEANEPMPFRSVITTGPMMKPEQKKHLLERAEKLPDVIFHRYSKHILQYLKHAQLVVCNGGFNMMCEILSYRKKSIFVPMPTPANEHLKRAEIFKELGLIDLISPDELSPESIGAKVREMFKQEHHNRFDHSRTVTIDIPQKGLETIMKRIRSFNNGAPLSIFRASS